MIKYVVIFIATLVIAFISLSFRVHIKQGISNLSFKHQYNIAEKGSKKHMARQTEQAYIKGLKQGYALAKAQYDNRLAILYCSSDEYICQKCNHRIHKNNTDTPKYCDTCGSKFYMLQPISHNPNEV